MIEKTMFTILNFFINNIKFIILKFLHPQNFKYSLYNFVSVFASVNIRKKGKISIGKKDKISQGALISALNSGEVKLGENVFINRNCYIVSHENIIIEDNVIIGPNTIILDHDHKFSIEGIEKKEYKKEKVKIGHDTWIGANCVILKGTNIGANCVIGAGSIVNCNVEDNSIFVQKKNTVIKKIGDRGRR